MCKFAAAAAAARGGAARGSDIAMNVS